MGEFFLKENEKMLQHSLYAAILENIDMRGFNCEQELPIWKSWWEVRLWNEHNENIYECLEQEKYSDKTDEKKAKGVKQEETL